MRIKFEAHNSTISVCKCDKCEYGSKAPKGEAYSLVCSCPDIPDPSFDVDRHCEFYTKRSK